MDTNPFINKALELHKKHRGKIALGIKTPIQTREDLNVVYTPGVGGVSRAIEANPDLAYELTAKGNSVAVISDGTAVLGFGDIGPLAALPVMEGKCVILKTVADIDAFPIVLGTKNPDDIITIIKALEPTYGAIQLEDIAAPQCFEIEERLERELSIPVMHDDQHGTAIVVLAALINALKVVRKNEKDVRVVTSGAGAAGIAITKLLYLYGFRHLTLLDSKGVISESRTDLHISKKSMLPFLDPKGSTLTESLKDSDIFIGVSAASIVHESMIRSMNADAIIFAMANPVPEVMPDTAKRGGARVIATGRSDFPNQINNALAFPGVFRGLLDYRIQKLTPEMKLRAAKALASLIENPDEENIIPDFFDMRVVPAVKNAMK